MQTKCKVVPVQQYDSDIQKDFLQVWMIIEKDIKNYELEVSRVQQIRSEETNDESQ